MLSLRRSVALIACISAGCGDAGGNRAGTVVRDSAGITIVENRRPLATVAVWWQIEEPAALDIGGIDVPQTHSLFRVVGATRLSDGRIVVASSGSNDVRYYSADGAHLLTSGRQGGGPREFQNIAGFVRLPGDSVLVSDPRSRRASILDSQGAFRRIVMTSGSAAQSTITGRFADGSLVGTTSNPFQFGPQPGLRRPDITFTRLSPGGELLDTIAVTPGAEYVANVNEAARSIQLTPPPFARATSHAVYGNRLYAGTQDAPEVMAYDTAGTLTHIIRTGAQLRQATEQRLQVYTQRALASAPPEQHENIRNRLRSTPVGEYLPAYGAIATDAAGNLWIADYDDPIGPSGEWNVFDPEGRTLARVRLPVGLRVFEIGDDYVLGISRDDYDTEHVVLYRLIKP